MNPTILTPEMVADRWGISTTTVRQLCKDGRLRSFRVGTKLLRITISAVEEFEKCQNTGLGGSGDDGSSQNTTKQGGASQDRTYLRMMRNRDRQDAKRRSGSENMR